MHTQGAVFRIVLLFLIFIIFVIAVYPGILQDLRYVVYRAFNKTIALKLDYQTRKYHTLEGDKFTVRHTEADRELAVYILALADDYYSEVEEMLGSTAAHHGKIPLVIYPDVDSLAKSFGQGGDKRAVGVYWADSIRLLSPRVWADAGSDADKIREKFREEGPLTHEITHLFIDHQTRGSYSRWFTEGMAQYAERQITGFILGEPSPSMKRKDLSLDQMEAAFDSESHQLLAYWRSLQAVDYLVDNFGLDRLKTFINELYQEGSFEKTFFRVYEFTPETLFKRI